MGRRLRWAALAFVPSSLLLGVTTYLTTDVAAIPLLWVLPLVLYLLSFVVVFSRMGTLVHGTMVVLLPVMVVLLLVPALANLDLTVVAMLALHLGAFFVAAMVCHGELALTRPPARFLTEYFLWISAGGVLGGAFNALVCALAVRSGRGVPAFYHAGLFPAPASGRRAPRFQDAGPGEDRPTAWPRACLITARTPGRLRDRGVDLVRPVDRRRDVCDLVR